MRISASIRPRRCRRYWASWAGWWSGCLHSRCGRARSRSGKTCFSPATGPIPGCRPPSRDRYGRETAPPILFLPCGGPDREASGLPGFRSGRAADREVSSEMHSVNKSVAIETRDLDTSIASATEALLEYRRPDGHWVFELEADSTIPAEYVLLRHYLGEPVDAELEAKIAK